MRSCGGSSSGAISAVAFRGRDITTAPLPAGSQSGEQWVRERYPRELRAFGGRRGAYLVVVTDADAGSTDDRRAELDAECERQGVPRRDSDDPVLVVVPRRSVETWLHHLGGQPVDELQRYPRLTARCDRRA